MRRGGAFDPTSEHVVVFMPWFFFDWRPDIETSDLDDDVPFKFTPAEAYLESKDSRYLDKLEVEYIEACLGSPFSFFEVIECRPGTGFKLRDVFTEQIKDVVEKMGSQQTQIGDIFFAKPATVQGLTALEACSPIRIPPIHKSHFVKVRNHLKRAYGKIDDHVLYMSCQDLITIYRSFFDSMKNPKAPTMVNMDGDLIEPRTLVFDIETPEVTFDGLHQLCTLETRETLLAQAEVDIEGKLKKIDFPWLELPKKNERKEPVVKGHITIDQNKMTVFFNSQKRAKKFLQILKKLKLQGIKLKTETVEPLDQYSKHGSLGPHRSTGNDDQTDDLVQNQQLQMYIENINKKHWID